MTKNRSRGESEFVVGGTARGAPDHDDRPPKRKITLGLDAAIKQLLNPPITRQELLDLFDNRASFACLRAWRYGWLAAPPWAVDLLQSKVKKRAAEMIRSVENIQGRIGGPGLRGAEHWRQYNERKARERDAKEKAPD